MTEHFEWLKPQPLWQEDGLDYRQPEFFQPHLFGYNSDAFVDEFMAAAQAGNGALAGSLVPPNEDGAPLKLFQPIHGSFYVVSGSLCCIEPGFPQRQVSLPDGESTFFVLRKVIGGAEYGWAAASVTAAGWQPVGNGGKALLDGEERLPLYQTAPRDGRTLLFGYVPASSKDTYNVGPAVLAQLTGDPESSFTDPRADELQSRFIDQVTVLVGMPTTRPVGGTTSQVRRDMSVFTLLDLWELFNRPDVLPDVAIALRDNPNASFSGEKAAQKTALMNFLKGAQWTASRTLASAIGQVANKQAQLDESESDPGALGFGNSYRLDAVLFSGPTLRSRFEAALSSATRPPLELPKIEPGGAATYIVRCVYERPQCDPVQWVISRPSEVFRFAAFFDKDAPARQIKIPLPTNVSLSDMRKFKKGVTFMISEPMQRKINMLPADTSKVITDPGQIGPELTGGFAFICSFSIEIIFIVAFFLLLMFVIILNFVFWWILFFRICLPVPKKILAGLSGS
ncbi:MAG: hypothetical protein KDI07_05005 [Anaerolineae bacterium]|nr:hypothetical protein [Anaerolineae bacterium]